MSRTGIVLAGGRSTRFGSDKLAQPWRGTTVLGATIEALATLTDRIILAGAALPAQGNAGNVPITIVEDARPFAGPLAAVDNVLNPFAGDAEDVALIVAGDMPRLVPAVLREMVVTLERDAAAEAVYLARSNAAIDQNHREPPRRQVLPLALRVQPASRAAREAVEAGERSLQALLHRIAAVELPFSAWRSFDPDGLTLLDVDTPEDMERLRSR